MIDHLVQRTMVLTAAVLCLAGIVEGIRNDTEGTAVLFGLVLAVGFGIVSQRAKRRPVEVRPDIREWLDDTASLTGETVEELANTALSAYRAELGGIQRDEYSA
jgi:hypothetical protein